MKRALCSVLFLSVLVFSFVSCKKDVTYTVAFDSNGGSECASVTVSQGGTADMPTPTKDHRAFLGWYLDDVQYDSTMVITANITLSAKWSDYFVYTVAFDTDGGGTVGSQTVEERTAATRPDDPKKDGNKFLGWQRNGVSYDFSSLVTEDITLSATWKDHITASAGSVTLENAFDESFTKSESAFTGWNTKADGTGDWYLSGKEYTFSSATDLYPQWLVLTIMNGLVYGYGAGDLSHCLVLPDGVTGIAGTAVFNSSLLQSVTIPGSVKEIGGYAFFHCAKLENLTMGNHVEAIGDRAFEGCSLVQNVTIPDSVKTIGDCSFSDCSQLANVTIPASVTDIGDNPFSGCSLQTSIGVDSGNGNFKSVDGVLFTKDGKRLITYPMKKTQDTYGIPSDVTDIGASAFYNNTNLTNVTIPDSVKTIGDHSFIACNLTGVLAIPDSVTGIGDSAFRNCGNLTGVTIGTGVTTIGDTTFNYCKKLTAITVASGNSAYETQDGILFTKGKTKLLAYPAGKTQTSYSIPASVEEIGYHAFYSSEKLTGVVMPTSVTDIGTSAFSYCAKDSTLTINYQGTEAQWNEVTKENYWNTYTTTSITYNYSGT